MKILCQICKIKKKKKNFRESLNIDFINDICNSCEEDLHNAIKEEEIERHNQDLAIIEEAKKNMNKEEVSALIEFMEETTNWDFKITELPIVSQKEEPEDYPFDIYINQTTNGGFSGDDYSGYVSIELKNKKYLTYFYSC